MSVDLLTRQNIVLQYEHHKIHDKQTNFISVYDDEVSSSTTSEVFFNINELTEFHFNYDIQSNVNSKIEILKNATMTTGTLINTYNLYNLDINNSETDVYIKNTTTSFTGTIIYQDVILTSGRRSTNGETSKGEFLLCGEKFLLRAMNIGVLAGIINIIGKYYELPCR
jgi:hypothetical protein